MCVCVWVGGCACVCVCVCVQGHRQKFCRGVSNVCASIAPMQNCEAMPTFYVLTKLILDFVLLEFSQPVTELSFQDI